MKNSIHVIKYLIDVIWFKFKLISHLLLDWLLLSYLNSKNSFSMIKFLIEITLDNNLFFLIILITCIFIILTLFIYIATYLICKISPHFIKEIKEYLKISKLKLRWFSYYFHKYFWMFLHIFSHQHINEFNSRNRDIWLLRIFIRKICIWFAFDWWRNCLLWSFYNKNIITNSIKKRGRGYLGTRAGRETWNQHL